MAHYRRDLKLPQTVDYAADDDDFDDDEMDDLDDDDVDGYDGLTDYDELEYPSECCKRDCYDSSNPGLDYIGHTLSANGNIDVRRHRSISEGCPRVLEHADDNRRDHHNHLERKRRASIKGSYNELREAIPGLRGSKASRAVTLQRAVEYIEELTKRNREHTRCVDKLTRQNELLDRQIHDLSRNCQLLEESEYSDHPYLDPGSVTNTDTLNQSAPNACVNIRFVSTVPSRNSVSCVPSESLPVFRVISHPSSKPSEVSQVLPTSGIVHLTQSIQTAQQHPTKQITSKLSVEPNSVSTIKSSSTSHSTSGAVSQPVINSGFQKIALSSNLTLLPVSIQNIPISSICKRSRDCSPPIMIVSQSIKKKVYATVDSSDTPQNNNLQLIRNDEEILPETSISTEVSNKFHSPCNGSKLTLTSMRSNTIINAYHSTQLAPTTKPLNSPLPDALGQPRSTSI